MTHSLPDGFTARSATLEDAQLVADLWNGRSEAVRGDRPSTPERVLQRWNHPKFDLATDSRLVFAPDGKLIGYAHIRDVKDPPVDVFSRSIVHPEHDDSTWLRDDLFDWIEREARRVIDRAPADARIALISGAPDEDRVEQHELERRDFKHERTFHWMVVDFADASLTAPDWPEGIEVRTLVPGVDDEALVAANRDAFSEHYGYLEQPFEAELAELRHWMAEDDFEADLWFLACEGTEVVGFCCCYAEAPGDAERGLIDVFGVRPAWRRRGIGRALLLHAFGEFSRRGTPGAVLTVDTENRTGALALYERAGMHADHSHYTYVKELRAGRNLVAQ
jgi:mycothiol synthase